MLETCSGQHHDRIAVRETGSCNGVIYQISLAQFKPITVSSWKIVNPAEIKDLYALITSPYRNLPVIVISQVNRNHWLSCVFFEFS